MKRTLITALFIALCIFLLANIISPAEWDFFDGFIAHLISGVATRNIVKEIPLGFAHFTPLFTWLQIHFDIIGWPGVVTVAMFFLSNTIFIFIILDSARKKFPDLSAGKLFIAGIPLFFIIQLTSVIKPSFTGLTFLLCGSAVLLVERFSAVKNWPLKIVVYLIAMLMYGWGASIRFDTPIAAAAIVGIYILLNSENLKKSITAQLPLIVLAVAAFLFVFNRVTDIPFIKSTEMELFYISDGDNDNNFSRGFSEKDSIKTDAIKRFFLNDEKELSITFIKSLAEKKLAIEQKMGFDILERLQSALHFSAPAILRYWQYLVLNIFLLILLFYLRHQSKWRVLIFQGLFWSMVFAVAYLARLEDRHYLYMAQLSIYCSLLFFFRNPANLQINSKTIYLSIGFITILFCYSVYSLFIYASDVKTKLANLDVAEKEINQQAMSKILLLDGASKDIFHGCPLNVRKFEGPREIIYYDMGHLPLLPEYNSYLNNLCHCNSRNVVEFYDYLIANRNNLLIISIDWRIEFIRSYLKIVHAKTINFKREEGNFAIQKVKSGSDSLFYYQILN